jgi:hypothetical protein
MKVGQEPYSMKGGDYYCPRCSPLPRFLRPS